MLLDNLEVLIKPHFWFRNEKSNAILSKFINDLLDKNPEIKMNNSYYVDLNGVKIWVENRFYGFGSLQDSRRFFNDILPDRKTAIRLWKYVKPAVKSFKDNEVHRFIKEVEHETTKQSTKQP